MPNTLDLSVVIVSYNTKKATLECINSVVKSLKNSKINYEIIVLDNASTDGSLNELMNYELRITNLKVVENKENLGFGRANNHGVKLAKGTYVLLLNSDTIVLNDAIEVLFRKIESDSNVHFIGAKLLNSDKSPQPSCGPFYTLPVIFGALFLRGDYWGLTRTSPGGFEKVDWISGACIMTRKKDYETLGGFDEGIFMYMEEIDLLMRARKHKMNTHVLSDAVIIHHGSLSSGGRTYPILQVYKGFLFLYKKHGSAWQLFCLKSMLQLKALVSVFIGRITKNKYLTETYAKAYQMVQTS